uniref:Biphenyl dioxygenase subunit beta n=1 Tax=Comamonas testosteroni TaxID=285 RepID=BPHE_COMTE|nr:RecName: Full=Biphenyl dioxygenase subunit beta; AltName: Full=Biphenyl 2,3-dioxygenase [Comamonas testosteroni]AAC44527.1 biphenyl dioxygenase terminal oxygenase beta subunit [Pandoraea pnomenusa]3GZX_B Chain B, Biphenyl dioxygenase subunit beta [Comamonas testosteroni]3GZY_B Chain B, Biphenyl dioxygenase subunit beta [Comamonas testosteroni]
MISTPLSKEFEWPAKPVSLELQHQVEQFYYREAQLLDHHAFQAWFALLAEDIHYWMPIRTVRTAREQGLEYVPAGANAHFDDTHATMYGRIRQKTSDLNWAEDPPSRTRHLVSNVIVREMDTPGTLEVASAFLLYRSRLERQVDVFAGERRDVLRIADNPLGFQIAKRTIILDQSTVLANNLSVFF